MKLAKEKVKGYEDMNESKKLPIMFRSNMADGVYRYTENGENIALIKEGDSYTIFDYESRNLTEPASIQEVNKALREYRNKNNSAETTKKGDAQFALPDSSKESKVLGEKIADFIEAVSQMLEQSKISKRKLKIAALSDSHKKL